MKKDSMLKLAIIGILAIAGLAGTATSLPSALGVNQVSADETSAYYNILDYGAKADDPQFDNAPIFNQIIQSMGKNGGTIYIPTGTFYLSSSIIIDRSYVSIVSDNSGLRSGIDAETDNSQAGGGGAQLLTSSSLTAIQIKSAASDRLSGISFSGFQIKGTDNNGFGIKAETDNDGIKISNMVINNVGTGIELQGADAPSIKDNWIAETMTAIKLRGASQQAEIKDNSLGAQPSGVTLDLENADRFNITGNNIYPDGASAMRLYNPTHGVVSGNTISSYYNGIIEMLPNAQGTYGNGNVISSNVISSNVISVENWTDNPSGRDSKWGILHIEGSSNRIDGNSIIANGAPENYSGILINKGDHNRINANSIGLDGPASNAKVVVNDAANDTLVSNSIADSEFQNGDNPSNSNSPA
ncbi:right-handed parallel beta-helix repeat-containing protein [Streptococcus dentiloxodontae]